MRSHTYAAPATLAHSHSLALLCVVVHPCFCQYNLLLYLLRNTATTITKHHLQLEDLPKASSSSGAGIRTNEPAVTVAAAAVTGLPSSLPCLIPRCLFSSSRRRLSFCRLCSAMARLFLAVLVALVALAASSSAYAPGDCFTVTASRLNVRASPCTCVARARRSSPPTCALTP